MSVPSTRLTVVLLVVSPLALWPGVRAQQPPAGEAAQKPPTTAKPADPDSAILRALVAPDAAAHGQAVEALFKAGKEGRGRLRNLVTRVAPAAAALPPVDKEAKPDPKAASEPIEAALQATVGELLGADSAKADAAAAKLTEGAASSTDQVRKVVTRSNAILSGYILRTFADQRESNAVFAGQYSPLNEIGPVALETVSTWMVTPPSRSGGANLRVQCIKAVRDLVEGKPDDKVTKALKDLATSALQDVNVQREAKFALAQFGDRSFIDPQIKKLEAQLESDKDATKAAALNELADIYYQLRDYPNAVTAYKQHVALIEDGKIDRKTVQGLPTLFYNACCSMALAGMTDDAFAYLQKAIDEGRERGAPLGRRLLAVDMDIESLRQDPRFAKAMASLEGKK